MMYGRIVVCMLLCGFVVSTCIYLTAESLFSKVYESIKDSNIREAETRLELFDLLLERIERDSLVNGHDALMELERRHARAPSASELDSASLAAEARELGVSDIYFIDSAGKVAASSLRSDIGLDLLALGKGFSAFIKGLYGQGRAVDQRLSQSSLSGLINSYQYYGPKGKDFVIEISTRLGDTISKSYPGLDYDALVSLAFGSIDADGGPKPIARIVDLITSRGISTWSLFQQRADRSRYAPLVEKAKKGEEAVDRGDGKITTVKAIKLSGGHSDFKDSSYYAVFEFDLGPIGHFRRVSLISAFLACALSAALSFAAMKRSFDRKIAGRIDRLRSDIARVAEGDYAHELTDCGRDEIGAIGDSVTEMVRTILDKEERLRAAQRMETVGAMAGGLAHDFGNIIAGISGILECMDLRLKSADPRPAELLELTDLAEKTARRGGDLVRSLIDIAAPRQPLREPADLAGIAREAAELMGPKAGKGVDIRVEAPEGPIIARCDTQAILRALLNLSINGIQAMTLMKPEGAAQGGILVIRAESRPETKEVALVVIDEGVGIASDEVGKVLAPFYSTKPRGMGSGIGLSIVLAVAESHGGRLELDSEPGKGSTFALVFPA